MAEQGKRRVQQKGEVTLPKEFRDEHELESGDKIYWKRHSKDHSKIIIEVG